ncbi:MAG: hypothetical protein PUB45_05245 [Bacteroidales bacterium]|nr:hypothetical protein [Bacteroidales bacterium]
MLLTIRGWYVAPSCEVTRFETLNGILSTSGSIEDFGKEIEVDFE